MMKRLKFMPFISELGININIPFWEFIAGNGINNIIDLQQSIRIMSDTLENLANDKKFLKKWYEILK